MTENSVSVIIPTHNRADMLRRAIQSVLGQTYQNFELIVVSDGSQDNTGEVVESFKDPRVRLLKHELARGSSVARNTGLRASSGEYIAFLDDDDEWMPTKLEAQMAVIQGSKPEVGLVYVWMEYVREDRVLNARKPTLRGYILPDMLDKQAITNSSTLLLKREVLNVVHGFDEELTRGDDGDFIRRIAKHFEVDFVPKVLCKVYVGHADRLSVPSRKNLLNGVKALDVRLKLFKEDFEKDQNAFSNVLFRIGTLYFLAGQPSKGLRYMLRAIGKNPSNHRLYINLSKLLIKKTLGLKRLADGESW